MTGEHDSDNEISGVVFGLPHRDENCEFRCGSAYSNSEPGCLVPAKAQQLPRLTILESLLLVH